jgi:MFS family permease
VTRSGSPATAGRRGRAGRLNRSLLGLLGAVFLVAGGTALAIHFGWLSRPRPAASVLPHQGAPHTWVFATAAAVAVVAGLLCLRWLAAQLPLRPRARIWQLESDTARGRTDLSTGVAVAPFTEEVTGYPGVRAVRATLAGTHRDPGLSVTINAAPDADLTSIRVQLAAEGLPRLRESLDLADLPTTVEFRVPTAPRRQQNRS